MIAEEGNKVPKQEFCKIGENGIPMLIEKSL